jgi:hypothetical protein
MVVHEYSSRRWTEPLRRACGDRHASTLRTDMTCDMTIDMTCDRGQQQ